jgi:4-hydroxy-3-polyprenylbenzoate decarboxylase
MKPVVLAITGASGSLYGVRLLEVLLAAGCEVYLTISPAAVRVFEEELRLPVRLDDFQLEPLLQSLDPFREPGHPPSGARPAETEALVPSLSPQVPTGKLHYCHPGDYSAGIASGSFQTAGMVVCPCSMGTLASLASGISTNLIHRAADVHLKERRKLIVVPRETPLSTIPLQNMKTLAEAGAVILPAMPGFYHQPRCLLDLVDFVVARICDHLGVSTQLMRRWGDTTPQN